MHETTIEKALQNLGLTERETQIYLHLAKYGIQKGGEIAKKTKTAKAIVYRILKILQRKGFVESSLESPVRYKAVPFETVLDSHIRAKHEEARQIETAKNDLLADWSKMSKGQPESPIEKFAVLEGNQKIYNRIYQMVKQTKNQLSVIVTVQEMIRADRYGISREISNHLLKNKIKIRFLTDVTNANTDSIRFLRRQLKRNAMWRCRNPELSENPFPRMIIRDQEEILFFITPKGNGTNVKNEETCLVTDCKSLIQAFSSVFENLWNASAEIGKKIIDVKKDSFAAKTIILSDAEKAKTQYYETLNSANKNILVVSSSAGFILVGEHISQLKELTRRGITLRIMAPITNENLATAQMLMQWCEIRHIPLGYFDTVIIDGQHLFQFNNISLGASLTLEMKAFENVLYTTDLDYIERTTRLLSNLWIETRAPSNSSLFQFRLQQEGSSELHKIVKRLDRYGLKEIKHSPARKIFEKDVLNKISEAKSNPSRYWSRTKWSDTLYFFGSRAFAQIRPPKNFDLPELIIAVFKNIGCSTYGPENLVKIFTLPEKKSNSRYQLVAQIQDNPKSMDYNLKVFKGMPVKDNIKLVKKNQISIRLQGNTLFAGWTVPIELSSSSYVLPPACILFEAYGKVKSGIFNFSFPSGRKQEVWFNNLEAFVTFFYRKSKYIGPGNEGILDRESMQISYPP